MLSGSVDLFCSTGLLVPDLRPLMDDMDLARRLRVLRRTVIMLQTELRHDHVDEELIA